MISYQIVTEAIASAPALEDIARRVVERYFGVRPGERFLVVTDTRTSPAIGPALFEAALAAGAEPAHVVIPPPARSGEEPPEQVAAALGAADVALCACSRSLYHTRAKGTAQERGARGCFNAPHRDEAWVNGAMTADFVELRALAERLAGRLAGAGAIRVTSPAGTDLTLEIGDRAPKGWLTGVCREPGEVSAFPGGEVSFPPLEGTARGTVVFEQVMSDVGPLAEPVVVTVRDGLAAEIEGGREAAGLRAAIDGVPNARNIAELGIGINPLARLGAEITEAKKRAGTAHVGLGDNAGGYGGVVESPLHLDGLILEATVEVDGEAVVRDGELLL